MYTNKNIKKVCSFCVSDLHLITMLLPYLNKGINEKEKFITILEKDLTKQVELVLSRLTLNNESKNYLLNIDWNCNILNREAIKKEVLKGNSINFIVNGTKEYIENTNSKLNKILDSIEIEGSVKIINCYDITKLDDDIKEILKTHDMILNTSGEKEISEVFEGYESKGA